MTFFRCNSTCSLCSLAHSMCVSFFLQMENIKIANICLKYPIIIITLLLLIQTFRCACFIRWDYGFNVTSGVPIMRSMDIILKSYQMLWVNALFFLRFFENILNERKKIHNATMIMHFNLKIVRLNPFFSFSLHIFLCENTI